MAVVGMGIFQSLSKSIGVSKELDVDSFMSAAEAEEVDVMHAKADAYIKPIALEHDSDLQLVEEELTAKNIVLLNVAAYARNPAKLKDAVARLKAFASKANGDMARIDGDKILLTPAKVKIAKSKKRF